MAEGWIKLHRNIQDHWIWSDAQKLKWWLDIVLLANHQDNKFLLGNELMKVERGERHTSEILLSERWKVSRKVVRSFLKLLESDGMITTKKTPKGTTLKVTNYNVYQGFLDGEGTTKGTTEEQPRVQQRDNEGTTEGTMEEHQRNNEGTMKGTQTIMNKKDKNDNKENNDKRMRENEEKNTPPLADKKNIIRDKILNTLGQVAYGSWFEKSDIKELDENIVIKPKDGFTKDIIKKKYLEKLNMVLPKKILLED